MRRDLSKWLCTLICAFPLAVSAQQPANLKPDGEYFREGRELFLQRNYAAALPQLKTYLYLCPKSENRMEANYMLVCSACELKDKHRIQKMKGFLEEFPDTPHANRVYALIAEAYYEEGDYDRALAFFNTTQLELLDNDERDQMTYVRARANLAVGNMKDAAVWFNTLVETDSRYQKDCLYYLSYIRYERGQYSQALEGFRTLQNDTSFGAPSCYYIAEISLINGQFEEAEGMARAYLDDYPEDEHVAEMQRILGSAWYHQGMYSEAVTALSDYMQSVENPRRDAEYMLGMSLFNTGVYSQAAENLGKVTAVSDELTQNAYYHMGLSYLQMADKSKARMAFEQASHLDFNRSVKELSAYNYALCLHETDYSAFGESVTALENFLNEFPDSPHASKVSSYLVEVYMSTRSYEAALGSIQRIAHPNHRIMEAKQRILFQMGTERLANADFTGAEQMFSQAIVLGQYNRQTMAEAYYWRGETRYRQNRFGEAQSDFHLFLLQNTEPKNEMVAMARYNLGYIAFQNHQYTQAKDAFIQYVSQTDGRNPQLQADACNRIGDCYFKSRHWKEAEHYYSEAMRMNEASGDYSFYQLAAVSGLQNDYSGKITLLNRLLGKYPKSPYAVTALYEIGRSYVNMENNSKAIASFRQLLSSYPESPLARKAASEIGLLYYQAGNFEQAIASYKYVVDKYPGSDEARMATSDLKSVYVDLNRVDEFAQWVNTIPGNVAFDATEQDSLTYIAAEKIYMKGRTEEAKGSMQRYLASYPNGAFFLNANYYLCEIADKQHNYDDVLNYSGVLMNYPDSPFTQEALVMRAQVLFNQSRTEEAMQTFKQIQNKTVNAERRIWAETYVLRCAYLLSDDIEIIQAATVLLGENRLETELRNEALYDRAKAYVRQHAVNKAQDDWKVLATDTRNVYGAEARYLLAQSYYDAGLLDKAEKEVLSYIECSTPHMYWLARSFVLLSDIYMKTGKDVDARQYLLSLQQNYQADDDIASMIEQRLNRLNQENR